MLFTLLIFFLKVKECTYFIHFIWLKQKYCKLFSPAYVPQYWKILVLYHEVTDCVKRKMESVLSKPSNSHWYCLLEDFRHAKKLWFYGRDSTRPFLPKILSPTFLELGHGPFHLDLHYSAHHIHSLGFHTSNLSVLQSITTILIFLKCKSSHSITAFKNLGHKRARNEATTWIRNGDVIETFTFSAWPSTWSLIMLFGLHGFRSLSKSSTPFQPSLFI